MRSKLPDRLVELRKDKGFYQSKDAAAALGIQYKTYLGYEHGTRNPSLETLIDIAKFYNVSVDYLLGITNKKNDEEGYIISVAELKKRYPELRDKLDEAGVEFLRLTEDDIDYEQVLKFIQWALAKKKK